MQGFWAARHDISERAAFEGFRTIFCFRSGSQDAYPTCGVPSGVRMFCLMYCIANILALVATALHSRTSFRSIFHLFDLLTLQLDAMPYLMIRFDSDSCTNRDKFKPSDGSQDKCCGCFVFRRGSIKHLKDASSLTSSQSFLEKLHSQHQFINKSSQRRSYGIFRPTTFDASEHPSLRTAAAAGASRLDRPLGILAMPAHSMGDGARLHSKQVYRR